MADDARQRILDAAFREFSLNGKAGARMQAIAERAQVNQAMLNYYYKSKDDLYMEIVRQSVYRCHKDHPKLLNLSQEAQRQSILDHIERDIRFWAANEDLLRLTLHDLLAGGEGMKLALREMLGDEEMRADAAKMMTGGLFRSKDPSQVMLHFTSLTLLSLIPLEAIREIYSSSASNAEFLEARIAAVRDLLEHGLFSEQTPGGKSAPNGEIQ
ncbi:TetR/AcrR family transcriptional regulator [candidate division KSB1 bacterium]|nr:MAG: TetR/AcrR family transcriptional regulator [candidate division KSB1 bacterium]